MKINELVKLVDNVLELADGLVASDITTKSFTNKDVLRIKRILINKEERALPIELLMCDIDCTVGAITVMEALGYSQVSETHEDISIYDQVSNEIACPSHYALFSDASEHKVLVFTAEGNMRSTTIDSILKDITTDLNNVIKHTPFTNITFTPMGESFHSLIEEVSLGENRILLNSGDNKLYRYNHNTNIEDLELLVEKHFSDYNVISSGYVELLNGVTLDPTIPTSYISKVVLAINENNKFILLTSNE